MQRLLDELFERGSILVLAVLMGAAVYWLWFRLLPEIPPSQVRVRGYIYLICAGLAPVSVILAGVAVLPDRKLSKAPKWASKTKD